MREQQAGTTASKRVRDDGSHGKTRRALVADLASEVKAVGCPVQVRHPQNLTSWIGLAKAAREEGPGCGESLQLEWFGTLKAHPSQLCG